MKVWLFDIRNIEGKEDEILPLLSEQRREKALRQIDPQERLRSIAAGYLLRGYFHDREIHINEYGKPYLDVGPCFSISHAGDYVGIVFSAYPVGLDIEGERKISPSVLEKCFKTVSNDDSENRRRWCIKEAIAKAEGKGMVGDFKAIPEEEGLVRYLGKNYSVKTTTFNGYTIAVAVKRKMTFELDPYEVPYR